jgi:phospholipid/cholesterol/gamma-HCH transport system substrate-binding protein
MDHKVNFFIVGIFVIGLNIFMATFLFWMGKYGFDEKSFDRYTIEMTQSVSGLNTEAPVKYRGVVVGSVEKIGISKDNSEVIEVGIAVEEGTPIKEDSIAELTAMGITGLSYIELKGGSKDSPLLKVGSSISAAPSLFDKLGKGATNVTEKLAESLERFNTVLNDKNIVAINHLLANMEKTTENLSEFLNKKNTKAIEEILQNTNSISREINEHSLDNINSLVNELRLLSAQGSTLIEQLQNSPRDILFKEQEEHFGPGE